MTNPWDQDEIIGAAAPWDADPIVEGQDFTFNPATDMSAYQKFMAGVGRSYHEGWRGLKQVGGAIADAVPGVDLTDWRAGLQSEIDDARRIDAPLMDTGWGQVGNFAGGLSQLYGPLGLLRGTRAAAAIFPATIAGSAVQGGVLGALQPTATGESRWTNAGAGAVTGGATAAAFKGLGMGYRAIRNRRAGLPVDDRQAAAILRSEAEDVANLARQAPSQVPGVQRSLAEETLDPGIARLERNLRSTVGRFDAQDRANNLARVNQLERIAGTDADYAAAEAAREASTTGLRDRAFAEGAKFDAQQSALRKAAADANTKAAADFAQENVRRRALGLPALDAPPSLSPTIPSAKEGLRKKLAGVSSMNAGRSAVQRSLNEVLGDLDKAADTVGGLYNVRKSIDDMLSGKAGSEKSYAQAATRELMQAKKMVDAEIAKRAPTFNDYITAYGIASKPINRMDIGRNLLAPSSGSAILDPSSGAQVLTPAQFSKKSRSLDDVAAKATGFAKAKASDILTPFDIAAIKNIQDDLERVNFRLTAGSGGGSPTFERTALDARLAKQATREAAGSVPVVGRYLQSFAEHLDKQKNERIRERLAYLVANPVEARRVLEALPPKSRDILSKALVQTGGSAGYAAAATVTTTDQPLEIDIIGGRSVPASQFEK